MNRGDIILITFPFSDLTSTKVRPALILSPENPAECDFLVALISSNVSRSHLATDYTLSADDIDFRETGLKTSSMFRMSKLHNLSKILAKRKLGYANAYLMKHLEIKLRMALGL